MFKKDLTVCDRYLAEAARATFQLTVHQRHFEIDGVDVKLLIRGNSAYSCIMRTKTQRWDYYENNLNFTQILRVEIKPSVGDDYPAVLRQMRVNQSNVLLVDNYTGVGATREQFIKTFAAANIAVVFLEAVERLANTAA